jgi:signal transduction histidine kinase
MEANQMKLLLKRVALAIVLVATCGAGWASPDRGSAEDAVAMVKKVVADMKKYGKKKVIQDVQAQDPRYRDRDLYVFIGGMDGITLANGINPRLAGKNLNGLKDADGKLVQKERLELARTKGSGWLDYRWPDPVSNEIKQKSTYLERFDDLIINCGIYKD